MTTGIGYRSLPQSAIINTRALSFSHKHPVLRKSILKKQLMSLSEQLHTLLIYAIGYLRLTWWNAILNRHVLFSHLSQSACENGLEFMAEGQKFLFSYFTDQRDQNQNTLFGRSCTDQAVHECLQSPLDPTAMNTDHIQPPVIPSWSISPPRVSFTCSCCS